MRGATFAIAAFAACLFAVAAPARAECANGQQASTQQQRSAGILGSIGEGLANAGLNRMGVHGDYSFRSNVRAFLTDAIACSLTSDEQQQAGNATTRALNGGVGANSSWTSGTRTNVSGHAAVTGQSTGSNGQTCRMVHNVAIVEGEEATVDQQYCMAQDGSWVRQA